jgi:hypothetical protein
MLMMMPSILQILKNAGLIENSTDWLGLGAAATAVNDDDDENDNDALIVGRDSITYCFVVDTAAADEEEDDEEELDAFTGGSS